MNGTELQNITKSYNMANFQQPVRPYPGYHKKVATVDDNIVAISISKPKDDRVWKLATFYVDEKFRGTGIGQHLLYHELRSWIENKVEKVFVTMSIGTLDLHKFFLQYGFYVEGINTRRYQGRSELVLGRNFFYTTVDKGSFPQFVRDIAECVFCCKVCRIDEGSFTFECLLPESNWAFITKHTTGRVAWSVSNDDASFTIQFNDGSETINFDLYEIETRFAPVKVDLPERKAIVVPIKAKWVEHMMEYRKPQQSLFAPLFDKLLLRTDNVYYCYPKCRDALRRGTPILFYVSGKGHQYAIGEALVLEHLIDVPEELYFNYGSMGIYDLKDIWSHVLEVGQDRGKALAIRFGWYVPFKKPVPLDIMKRLSPSFNWQGLHPMRYNEFRKISEKGMKPDA